MKSQPRGLFRGYQLVREEVQDALRNALKGTVTALLLACEMALQLAICRAEPKSDAHRLRWQRRSASNSKLQLDALVAKTK
jgi:hypothetical protein